MLFRSKLNITLTTLNYTVYYTAWVMKNGMATAVFLAGQNYTGSSADTYYESAMSPFIIETTFSSRETLGQLTSSALTHPTGTFTAMIGPTSVEETTYAANSLPASYSECGFSGTFQSFSLTVGSVAGRAPLITGFNFEGSLDLGTGPQNYSLTLQVQSVTKA